MAKRITIGIDVKGRVITDFSGFAGDSCKNEAARLRAKLAEYGLDLGLEAMQPKDTEAEVIAEAETETENEC